MAVALVVGVVASTAIGQESEREGRVIHRYFDASQWIDGGGTAVPPAEAETGQGLEGSARQPDRLPGEAPGLWLSPIGPEWIYTPDGPEGPEGIEEPHGPLREDATTRLDGDTDRVDQLDYTASFEPSVVPFKRVGIHNRAYVDADGDVVADLDPGDHSAVPVGGELREGEERFWGTFLLRVEPGEHQAIPGVAPDQRVLSVQSEPRVEVKLRRDEAGRIFGGVEDYEGVVRLNLELAVDRWYFDGAVDRDVGWDAFRPGVGLDDELVERAEEVLQMIGVDRQTSTPAEALERLVEYHRRFEARPAPHLSADRRYREISRRQVGVCRHRGVVFMITARALGFETRYVYNEAHAFVEVHWPTDGWRRIDLGGAVEDFDLSNTSAGSIHDGLDDQEFPRPPGYEEEMARFGDGDIDDEAGEEGTEDASQELPEDHREPTDEALDSSFDDATAVEIEEASDEEPEIVPEVEVVEADGEVYRGGELRVRGRVVPWKPDAEVEVMIVPATTGASGGVQLGTSVVDDDGTFEETWEIPADLGLGRWRLEGRLVE